MSMSRMFRKLAHFHVTHPEIKPLTFAVTFGSIVACTFPIYSYCQNMGVGIGEDYTKNKKMSWYNYITPAQRKHYSENDEKLEKLRNELFEEANKKSAK